MSSGQGVLTLRREGGWVSGTLQLLCHAEGLPAWPSEVHFAARGKHWLRPGQPCRVVVKYKHDKTPWVVSVPLHARMWQGSFGMRASVHLCAVCSLCSVVALCAGLCSIYFVCWLAACPSGM